jgi:preprotein translocase subunit Sss1
MKSLLKLAFDATSEAEIQKVIEAAEKPTTNEAMQAGMVIGVGITAAAAAAGYGVYKGVEYLRSRKKQTS